MDIDLFQGILLGLLAVGLIVLIALLATLGGIKRALERAPSPEAGAAPATSPAPAQAEPVAAEPEPVAAAAAVTPSAQAAPEARTEPAAGGTRPSEEDSQAATIRAVLSQHGVTEASSSTSSASAAPTAEPSSVVAAHIDSDEPEEEPFQRDGRWWFKRGGELLVYNEGTAQWEPADRPEHWSGDTATTSIAAAPAAASTTAPSPTAATAPQPAVSGAGTGWKCPSCGAINGSTAASCRMCFTARP